MSDDLVLFTSAYPYGKSEYFLETELPIIARYFKNITIQPMTFGGWPTARSVPSNVRVNQPILPESRFRKFSVGVLNFFRYVDLRNEILGEKIFLSKKRLYNYILAVAVRSYWRQSRSNLKCKFLYFYWGVGAAYLVKEVQAETGAEVVMRFHGGDVYEELSDGYLPLRDLLFKYTAYICPVSVHGKDYLVKKYPQIKSKVYVSRLGTTDLGFGCFKPTHNRMVLVSCGNLLPVKRIPSLARSIGQQSFNITWHHFGDGVEMSSLKTEIEKFPENITVVLHGRRPNGEVLDFYSKNHVDSFVSVSESEGVPVSIMEAMSFGIPIIATDVGGSVEILLKEGSVVLEKYYSPVEFNSALKEIMKISKNKTIRNNIRNHWEHMACGEKNYDKFVRRFFRGNV